MTAETLYPAKLYPIGRREFLGFVMRHPEVYQVFSEELTREFTMACEQLRTVGLSSSAPEKLARLLLDWSENGQAGESGTKVRFSMTHEEIGEFIGASRETVTRTLSTFQEPPPGVVSRFACLPYPAKQRWQITQVADSSYLSSART